MFFKLINKFDIEQKQEVKHNPLQKNKTTKQRVLHINL